MEKYCIFCLSLWFDCDWIPQFESRPVSPKRFIETLGVAARLDWQSGTGSIYFPTFLQTYTVRKKYFLFLYSQILQIANTKIIDWSYRRAKFGHANFNIFTHPPPPQPQTYYYIMIKTLCSQSQSLEAERWAFLFESIFYITLSIKGIDPLVAFKAIQGKKKQQVE